MFIGALFIMATTWKQPRCPSADKWIRKLWYIYTMEYYSAIKKNTFESVLMRWMKLEPIIQSEKWKWKWSRSVMSDSLWPHGLYSPWNSPGKNTGVGSLSLLQGTFPTQGSNPGLSHCRQTLYQLSHKVFRSDQISRSVVSDSLRPHDLQHARPPCPSPTPAVHSNSCPSSQWCHPAISSSVVPFSSCPQSLPASESFPMS